VLKITRRIFPYDSFKNHPKKICFYNHINLCPCPEILNDTNYKTNIKHLVKFLNRKTKTVIRNLERERTIKSKNEKFEDALKIQKQINAIKYITSPIVKPFEYELNPNFKSDLKEKELQNLKMVLLLNNTNVKKLDRIECFDISNTSGNDSVGSMVVFINGEKQTSLYKRFKIINVDKSPNDFLAMQEIIERRLKHSEWGTPDLIIVDGGKPQVSAGLKAILKYKLNIPIIGLSKREETIITSNFGKIKLSKSSNALHLLMRVRDEAHRFAITYHKLLRSKSTFK